MFALYGNLIAEEGKGEELLEILLKAAEEMKNVPGNHQYIVGTNEEYKDTVFVFELWDDEEAHEKSLELPVVENLVRAGMPIIRNMQDYPSMQVKSR